jgi:hypothetical protein
VGEVIALLGGEESNTKNERISLGIEMLRNVQEQI